MRFRELFEAEHTAVKGDTLWALSKKYGVPIADIAKASGISDPNKIKIGQKITIPGVTPAVAPIPAPAPSFRQPKVAATPPLPRPDPRAAAKPELQTLPPPPMATLPPTSATQVKAPSASAPANPLTGPGGMTGTVPVDPVAAAKARAAEAGKQAAALQSQIDAGNASLAAKQKAAAQPAALSPQQIAKQARDEKAFAGNGPAPTTNPLTGPGGMTGTAPKAPANPLTGPGGMTGTAPQVVDNDPTTDSPEEIQAAQDDIFKDRLAQADAEELDAAAAKQGAMDNVLKSPSSGTDLDDPLNSATLSKWADQQAVKKAAQTKVDATPPKAGDSFDIARYLRSVSP